MLRPDELGKVQPGYLADLILVDGDPLADITILQDHDRLHYIMKDGKFHKENAADEAPAPDPGNMPATAAPSSWSPSAPDTAREADTRDPGCRPPGTSGSRR